MNCLKCGHEWKPRTKKPLKCPHCAQPKWWEPRKKDKPVEVVEKPIEKPIEKPVEKQPEPATEKPVCPLCSKPDAVVPWAAPFFRCLSCMANFEVSK